MPQCDRSRRRGSDEQGPRIVHIELSSQEGEKLEGSTPKFWSRRQRRRRKDCVA